MSGQALLSASGVVGGYGGADILHGVDRTVGRREIVGIVGPNGAGKSTALKAIFGLLSLGSGTIRFDGRDITGWAPNRIVRCGIGYVPQVDNVFREMTVAENLEMGAFLRSTGVAEALERVYRLFPDLVEKRRKPAGNLSGGQRQMVAFGRALTLDPKLQIRRATGREKVCQNGSISVVAFSL